MCIVLKFGGASCATPEHFLNIAQIVLKHKKEHPHVVVVISAMQGVTDELEVLAKRVAKEPNKRELDMLLSIGERVSMSLLAMRLHDLGFDAVSLTGSQCGIITSDEHNDAKIIDVKPERIENYLQQDRIVIVAGFQGVSENKEITTLGRGGSDTTAVALGAKLGAKEVVFYKDVPGVFDKDPKRFEDAKRFENMTFDEVLELTEKGAKILQNRCVVLAKKNRLLLKVISFKEHTGTTISSAGIKPKTPQFEELDFLFATHQTKKSDEY